MTVQELIEELKFMNPEAEVHFEYCYGDHWRTTVAPKVTQVQDGLVQWSEYHRMPKVVDFDDEEGDTATEVVILG